MKKIILILILAISMQSCGQETNTYWKSENVTKIDSKPFWGITSAYMDMIAEMRIHLSTNNDSLFIDYPFEKKIKISEFQSFTNCKIPSTGQLLDSIYDVSITNNALKIKFYYNGTADEEKRFSLNFVNVDKETFHKEVKNLKEEKSIILDKIKNIDLSTLEIPKKPEYLSEQSILQQLNPIQLAEELVDNNNSFQMISNTFSISKDKNQLNYANTGVINSDKLSKIVAHINDINFNNIEYIENEKTKSIDAVFVSKNKMNHKEIMALYQFISSNVNTNTIEQFGLPKLYSEGDSLGIHNFLAITWKTKDKVIKLAIEDIPDELWDKGIDNNIALQDNYTAKDIDKVFRHYLPLIGTSEIKLFIVSTDFDQALHLKENNPGSKSWVNMYDYTFKWRYLHEILENE